MAKSQEDMEFVGNEVNLVQEDSLSKIEDNQKRYWGSEKGKETQRKYHASDKGKAARKRYLDSDKGKAALLRYNLSKKGKEAREKANSMKKHMAGFSKFLEDNPELPVTEETLNQYLETLKEESNV